MAQFLADLEQKPAGHPPSPSAPPAAYPMSPDVVANSGTRWREVSNLLGGEAIAYDLTLPDGTRATLYVLRLQSGLPALPNGPPKVSAHMTQGRSIALWQKTTPSGGVLYGLAVDGGASSYRRLLRVFPVV